MIGILPSPPYYIKLYPELSAAALKARLNKEIAVWYELREINSWGSGQIDYYYAIVVLVSLFGYSRRTAYRILKGGEGKFCEIGRTKRTRIKIYGLKSVTASLGVSYLSCLIKINAINIRGRKEQRVKTQPVISEQENERPSRVGQNNRPPTHQKSAE